MFALNYRPGLIRMITFGAKAKLLKTSSSWPIPWLNWRLWWPWCPALPRPFISSSSTSMSLRLPPKSLRAQTLFLIFVTFHFAHTQTSVFICIYIYMHMLGCVVYAWTKSVGRIYLCVAEWYHPGPGIVRFQRTIQDWKLIYTNGSRNFENHINVRVVTVPVRDNGQNGLGHNF